MTDDRAQDSVLRLLRLMAEQLESFLDGDETAFETLGERIEERGFSADDLQSAALVLRSLSGAQAEATAAFVEHFPGNHALRILSDEERDSLSTEAWGYLLDLRRRGSLDPSQFERVLELLTGSGVRPIGVDLAREVATRVALEVEGTPPPGEPPHGDVDVIH